uniref:ATP-dependent DNA helicase UvrD/PcrA n=1 Tax=Klebsiella pneumoniae TaxID=573 RepID=A0A8B0SSV2_KLEPN|nr:ATP-dependent DNA helicase UvrD/PcrA [Klebsiella pneumoniae]
MDTVWKHMSSKKSYFFNKLIYLLMHQSLPKTLHKHMAPMMTDTRVKEEIENRF